MAICEESEGTDADKAARENMEKEPPQKLLGGEGHLSLLIAVCIILPAESDLIMLEGHQTVVGDGNAMSIAGKITQYMMGTAEGGLSIDDPVLTE
jgi:hypothetical protein